MSKKYPNAPCILCAEKHFSLAMVLSYEIGYMEENRQFIIGELSAAALHICKEHPELAESIRSIRHLIQYRKESEVNWNPICIELSKIAEKCLLDNPI